MVWVFIFGYIIKMQNIKKITLKSAKSILNLFPFLIGIILLMSLINSIISKAHLEKIFSKNIFLDSIVGSSFGSILAGNPVTSYIMGGEFLKQGVSLTAITAFLVSWVTVGLAQFPAEANVFGKKFALMRNLLSFLFSICIAIITVFIYENI